MLHLGVEHLSQTFDRAGLVDNTVHQHELIDKIIVKLGRQQVKHIKRHRRQYNGDQTAIEPTPLFVFVYTHLSKQQLLLPKHGKNTKNLRIPSLILLENAPNG